MPKQTKTSNKITKKNFHEYIIVNDNLICKDSGEIIHNINMILEYTSLSSQFNKDIKSSIVRLYKNKWLTKSKFTKLYHSELDQLIDLSYISKTILVTFMCMLTKSNNEILYHNNTPSNKDISLLTGLCENSILKGMKELENENIIYKTSKYKDRKIFVNPNYSFNGTNLLGEVYKMFNKGST